MTTKQAEIKRGRNISGVWIIPLLALVLGIYMVVHNLMTEGPEIEIAFKTAAGLEEGKTKVKYRNVNMGTVEKVQLNENFDGVIATVKMDRQTIPLLREDTRFWVVTARVGLDNISGLDTLMSGAYIQLAPGDSKRSERSFVALERPPLTPAGAPGLRLKLTHESASSVSTGDAVLYKGYTVGRVESMEFDTDSSRIVYKIFIDAPYHKLVNSNVRFWDVSGVSLSANASGFKVETSSLDTVLFGGVAFGVPDEITATGKPVAAGTEFKLYSSYEDILDNPYKHGTYYVVSFTESLKGLLPGADVEYRGIRVGRVERILLKESMGRADAEKEEGKGGAIPILIYLEPGRMELPDQESSVDIMRRSVAIGVTNGMRATLESGSLLTGAKYVNIDYYPNAEKASLGTFMEYTTIPTIDTGLARLEQKLNAVLDTINALPLGDTVDSANNAIASLNQSLDSLNAILENQDTQQLPAQLNETLQELSDAVSGLAPDSEAYQNVNSSLLSLDRALNNLEALTRTLSEQPSALVLPTNATPDPIPKVKEQ